MVKLFIYFCVIVIGNFAFAADKVFFNKTNNYQLTVPSDWVLDTAEADESDVNPEDANAVAIKTNGCKSEGHCFLIVTALKNSTWPQDKIEFLKKIEAEKKHWNDRYNYIKSKNGDNEKGLYLEDISVADKKGNFQVTTYRICEATKDILMLQFYGNYAGKFSELNTEDLVIKSVKPEFLSILNSFECRPFKKAAKAKK